MSLSSLGPITAVVLTSLSLLSLGLVVAAGRTAWHDERARIVVVAVGATVGSVFLLHLATGLGAGRYGVQAMVLLPLAVALGIGEVSDEIAVDPRFRRSDVVTLGLVVLVVLPYASAVGTTVTGPGSPQEVGVFPDRGQHFERGAGEIDRTVATAPNETVVLSTLHVGQGVLDYYNTGTYEVHGVPSDVFDGRRLTASMHENQVYDETNREHGQRLSDLVQGKRTVIVYLVHGHARDRYSSVKLALERRGYTEVERFGTTEAGYATFERETDTGG